MILCVLPGADRKSCVAVDVDPAGEIVTDLDEKQTSFSIGVQADLPRSIHLFAGGYRIFKGIAQNDRHVIGVDPLFCRIKEKRLHQKQDCNLQDYAHDRAGQRHFDNISQTGDEDLADKIYCAPHAAAQRPVRMMSVL